MGGKSIRALVLRVLVREACAGRPCAASHRPVRRPKRCADAHGAILQHDRPTVGRPGAADPHADHRLLLWHPLGTPIVRGGPSHVVRLDAGTELAGPHHNDAGRDQDPVDLGKCRARREENTAASRRAGVSSMPSMAIPCCPARRSNVPVPHPEVEPTTRRCEVFRHREQPSIPPRANVLAAQMPSCSGDAPARAEDFLVKLFQSLHRRGRVADVHEAAALAAPQVIAIRREQIFPLLGAATVASGSGRRWIQGSYTAAAAHATTCRGPGSPGTPVR